jgi:hypothetical protein
MTKKTRKERADIADFCDLYNKMEITYKRCGEGCYSTVFKNKDKFSVIKLTDDVAYLRFVEKIVLKHPSIHFPKIYDMTAFYYDKKYIAHVLIIEKLNDRLKRGVNNKTTNKIFSTIDRHRLWDNSLHPHRKYPASYQESISLLKEFAKRRNDISVDLEISKGFYHNVMFRDNNDLVITDPFSPITNSMG